MDYILDIIINKQEIQSAGLTEKLCEWDGEKYSYTPVQYVTDSNIEFEKIENVQYFNKITGIAMPKDVIALSLKSPILHDLEYDINSDLTKLMENTLLIFLKNLSKLSMFYILLLREDENIKEFQEIITDEEMCRVLRDSLKWSNPKDILLFKNNIKKQVIK